MKHKGIMSLDAWQTFVSKVADGTCQPIRGQLLDGQSMTQLTDQRLSELELEVERHMWPGGVLVDCAPEFIELIRGYREMRAILREWIRQELPAINEGGALCYSCGRVGDHETWCIVGRREMRPLLREWMRQQFQANGEANVHCYSCGRVEGHETWCIVARTEDALGGELSREIAGSLLEQRKQIEER